MELHMTFVCLSVCLSVCLLCVCLSISLCLSLCLSVCLPVWHCLSVRQSHCMSVSLCVCPSVSWYVSVCLFACLAVCSSACPSLPLPHLASCGFLLLACSQKCHRPWRCCHIYLPKSLPAVSLSPVSPHSAECKILFNASWQLTEAISFTCITYFAIRIGSRGQRGQRGQQSSVGVQVVTRNWHSDKLPLVTGWTWANSLLLHLLFLLLLSSPSWKRPI